MADTDTLCGWGDKGKVAWFVENSENIIPRRREQLGLLAELLPWPSDEAISVLDLGAGFGAATEVVLDRYPNSTVTCVDGSAEMVRMARDRMAKYGARVRIFHADLAEPDWRRAIAAPFHAAISAVAIHHLTDERKGRLYREVCELLLPGGVFLNNDIVATPLAFKTRFEDLSLRSIQEQQRLTRGVVRSLDEIRTEIRAQLHSAGPRHHSSIAPLADQLEWLRAAGFTSVDCYWKFFELAIFGGARE